MCHFFVCKNSQKFFNFANCMDNISSEIISQVNTSIGEIPSDSLALISDVGHNNVYRLTQGGRVFAVKTIKPDDANAALQLQFLRREFQLLSSLQSPYIVSVWQMTTHKQLGECLIMEFVDGRTLDVFLKEKVSDKQRHAVLSELLQAVEYMHNKQIVHADLKPQNILITHNGNHVKIIDLGLSDSSCWRTYNIGNTRQYAAPEQQDANNTLDQRTDIYALGHLLKLLFPHRYGSIAKKCLQPNPKDRYASVAALRSAINSYPYKIALCVLLVITAFVLAWFLYANRQTTQLEPQIEPEPTAVLDTIAAADTIAIVQQEKETPKQDSAKVKPLPVKKPKSKTAKPIEPAPKQEESEFELFPANDDDFYSQIELTPEEHDALVERYQESPEDDELDEKTSEPKILVKIKHKSDSLHTVWYNKCVEEIANIPLPYNEFANAHFEKYRRLSMMYMMRDIRAHIKYEFDIAAIYNNSDEEILSKALKEVNKYASLHDMCDPSSNSTTKCDSLLNFLHNYTNKVKYGSK